MPGERTDSTASSAVPGAALAARQLEQILDQGRQPVGVAQDHIQILPSLLDGDLAAAQSLGKATDRRERRAKLV